MFYVNRKINTLTIALVSKVVVSKITEGESLDHSSNQVDSRKYQYNKEFPPRLWKQKTRFVTW